MREVLAGSPITDVAVRYGVSRQAVHGWRRRYEAGWAAMRSHGIPSAVLTDNGKHFTGRFTKPIPAEVLFERVCRENGTTGRRIKPCSPTTTGKV